MSRVHDPILDSPGIASDLIDSSGGFYLAKICNTLGVEKATFAHMTQRRVESVATLFGDLSTDEIN